MKEGDRNTKVFDKMANVHRRKNFVVRIEVNGVSLFGKNEIKVGMIKAFHNL